MIISALTSLLYNPNLDLKSVLDGYKVVKEVETEKNKPVEKTKILNSYDAFYGGNEIYSYDEMK